MDRFFFKGQIHLLSNKVTGCFMVVLCFFLLKKAKRRQNANPVACPVFQRILLLFKQSPLLNHATAPSAALVAK